MLKTKVIIEDIEELDKYIQFVDRFSKMKTDVKFQKFMQIKCLHALNEVIADRLHGTTNEEYIEEYKLRNQIKEEPDGFLIYNDFTIPAILTTQSNATRNYIEGFSIALAFEYGVGIVGQENAVLGAWEYNVNNHEKGWYYKNTKGDVLFTQGYKGLEIYGQTAIKIENNLSKWVEEYFRKEVR